MLWELIHDGAILIKKSIYVGRLIKLHRRMIIIQSLKEFIKRIICVVWHAIYNCRRLKFYPSCEISLKSKFEGANKLYQYVSFRGSMGYGSYIGPHCEVEAIIGRFTSIASYVKNNRGTHPYSYPYVTTSPMFFSTQLQNGKTFAKEMMYDEFRDFVQVGNDCWIGEKAFLVGGITIGDGAVVLAGAIVAKNVPPYAIVGGIPAKVIKYRYDEETIKFLLDFKWWTRDISWFEENWRLLCDIDKLKEYAKNEVL